jgi:thiol-disulfide isomerase/thioredoxin
MVAVPSTMLPLGTRVPDFALQDAVTGRTIKPADFREAKALLVMFICNHCPYVQHVKPELGRIAQQYQPKGVGIVAINSNDLAAYPQDDPAHMKALAQEEGWTFPFAMDASQEVAKAFRAACTPDFYLFDRDRKLVYRGQLDGSRPGGDVPLAGNPVAKEQTPSVGCNIKWMKGNEPEWFG